MSDSRAGPAIEVCHLTRSFRGNGSARPTLANDDVSFSVARGQIFGLLGPNGAGKTTLVSQMIGLVRPTSGTITIEGIDAIADPDTVKATTGFLPQTGLSMRLIEVHRALYYTGRLRGQSPCDARLQTAEMIERLDIGEHADRYVDKLSGGMRRMVNFGMALMGRPRLLVLDEPTNELDPKNRRLVWDVVTERSAADGTTVVLVTHNVLEAEKTVHRVAVMHRGRISAMGTPAELKARADDRTRMELYLKDGAELYADELARLAQVGQVERGNRDGLYLVQSEPERAPALMDAVVSGIGLARLDDFRMARPTLEDVYLKLDLAAREAERSGIPLPVPATAAPVVVAAKRVTTVSVPSPPVATLTSRPSRTVRGRMRAMAVAFKYLWLEQMLEFRTTWSWSLMFGFLMPLAMVFGLTRIGTGLTDRTSLLYIVTGAAVFAVATEGVATLAQRIGVIKNDGMMLYYASLPISKASFLAAMVLSRLLLIMPGLVTPILAGVFFFGADFTISPVLLLVLPITCLALSAIGMTIGTLIDSMDLIVVITNLLIFVLLLASPVLIPVEALPLPLQMLGYLLPPTYAASALRHALSGDLGAGFLLDLSILSGMAVLGLIASARWIRWRIA